MLLACLEHAETRDLRDVRQWIVEATMRALKLKAMYGSTADIADALCQLAPYLRGDEVYQALAMATPVRAIAPRVGALAAVALALPAEERAPVLLAAWQAAPRGDRGGGSAPLPRGG